MRISRSSVPPRVTFTPGIVTSPLASGVTKPICESALLAICRTV